MAGFYFIFLHFVHMTLNITDFCLCGCTIVQMTVDLTRNKHNSSFYIGQQASNLAVLFAARSTDLDSRRYIGGLFWSANLTPRRVHFSPSP